MAWSQADCQIGINVEGVELQQNHASTSAKPMANGTTPSHPVFLIGMRGAGKTYIGKMAAQALQGEFTDADDVFAERTKMSVSDFVAKNDWAEFRRVEREILSDMTQEKRGNHVIALGGGVVETPEARDLLQQHVEKGGKVVYVTRELAEIEGYLDSIGATAARPKWGEDFATVFERRSPWYKQCSSHEFYNTLEPLAGQSQGEHHTAMRAECERFFRFISGLVSNRPDLESGIPTSFLSLTFADIRPALAQMDELTEGADAVELRVDLLNPSGNAPTTPGLPPISYVAKQLSMLRLVTSLPIVFSVRTKDQGGLASSTDEKAYLDMVRLGVRSACEYVDLEMAWPTSLLDTVKKEKGESHIIASWHDWTGKMKWDGSTVTSKYTQCSSYGDVVKIVGTATSLADNLSLATFATSVKTGKPFLGINMGGQGQLSRILNPTLTPVTHASLPSRAAPGQLTNRQVLQGRHLMGLLPTKQFYLFGSPIAASVSPTLHNTGFDTIGIPHNYGRYETTETDEEVRRIIRSPEFGGASVTIPLKLKIMDLLDTVSEDAKVIGAVNTIVPVERDGQVKLHGDNTDWQAIRQAAQDGFSGSSDGPCGLVIGAGGTCRAAIYALHRLGAKSILLFNRTTANAQTVADSFPAEYGIQVISSLSDLPSESSVVISTVPGISLTLDQSPDGIHLPSSILSLKGGIAIDLAYKPHKTALVRLAEKTEGWKAVTGVEILCLQGFKQFELWTGKRAPEGKIREAVMKEYFRS